MDAKYVIFDSESYGEFPVVFPAMINHSKIADSVVSRYPGIKPIRAGHINTLLACYGESVSLKLKSNLKIDTALIRRMLLDELFGGGDEDNDR